MVWLLSTGHAAPLPICGLMISFVRVMRPARLPFLHCASGATSQSAQPLQSEASQSCGHTLSSHSASSVRYFFSGHCPLPVVASTAWDTMLRVRILVPTPHVAEHAPKLDQLDAMQSTGHSPM